MIASPAHAVMQTVIISSRTPQVYFVWLNEPVDCHAAYCSLGISLYSYPTDRICVCNVGSAIHQGQILEAYY